VLLTKLRRQSVSFSLTGSAAKIIKATLILSWRILADVSSKNLGGRKTMVIAMIEAPITPTMLNTTSEIEDICLSPPGIER
jgi:hypothetical protein